MFVRVKTTPNSPRKSIQVVESYRINHQVKQKILCHVGIAMNEQEEQKLRDLAHARAISREDTSFSFRRNLSTSQSSALS